MSDERRTPSERAIDGAALMSDCDETRAARRIACDGPRDTQPAAYFVLAHSSATMIFTSSLMFGTYSLMPNSLRLIEKVASKPAR